MGLTDPGIPRRASRIILNFLPAYACQSASAHTPITVVRTEFVVISVRFLAVTGCLFFLRWLHVYIGLRFPRGIGFEWNYYTLFTSHSSFSPRITLVTPFGVYTV